MKTRLLNVCILGVLIGNNVVAQTPPPDCASAGEVRTDAAVSKLAATLGASLSNKEAKRQFDSEPFFADGAQAVFRGGRWEWRATVGYGKGDLLATVSFGPDGSEPKVEIVSLVDGDDY